MTDSPNDIIEVECPECLGLMRAYRRSIGKTIKCPHCKEPFIMPPEEDEDAKEHANVKQYTPSVLQRVPIGEDRQKAIEVWCLQKIDSSATELRISHIDELPQAKEQIYEDLQGDTKRGSNPIAATGELAYADEQRIGKELQLACHFMASIEVEKAYWILLPYAHERQSVWVNAMDGENSDFPGVRMPVAVFYNPSEREEAQLVNTMAKTQWVLHVHNHPQLPVHGYNSSPTPSRADRSFASRWKSTRGSLLVRKLKFFVIAEDHAVEYALG